MMGFMNFDYMVTYAKLALNSARAANANLVGGTYVVVPTVTPTALFDSQPTLDHIFNHSSLLLSDLAVTAGRNYR